MPTFYGPTNIPPPWRAFKLGTPVIYSDLDGLRDQVEGVGLLVGCMIQKLLQLSLRTN